jgi:hypothetical protein
MYEATQAVHGRHGFAHLPSRTSNAMENQQTRMSTYNSEAAVAGSQQASGPKTVSPEKSPPSPDQGSGSVLHDLISQGNLKSDLERVNNRSTGSREALTKDCDGNTPLHLLAKQYLDRNKARCAAYYDKVLDLLLQIALKGDPIVNLQGRNALHVACANDKPDVDTISRMIEIFPLLKEGRDGDGKRPYDLSSHAAVQAAFDGDDPSNKHAEQGGGEAQPPTGIVAETMHNADTPLDRSETQRGQGEDRTKSVKVEFDHDKLDPCPHREKPCNCNAFFFRMIKQQLTRKEARTMNAELNEPVKATLDQKYIIETLATLEEQVKKQETLPESQFGDVMDKFVRWCESTNKVLEICKHEGDCDSCNRNHPIFHLKSDWKKEGLIINVTKLNSAIRVCAAFKECSLDCEDIKSRFKKAMAAHFALSAQNGEDGKKLNSENETIKSEKAALEAKVKILETRNAILREQLLSQNKLHQTLKQEKRDLEKKLIARESDRRMEDAIIRSADTYISKLIDHSMAVKSLIHNRSSLDEFYTAVCGMTDDPATNAEHYNDPPEILIIMSERLIELLTNDEKIWKNKEPQLEQLSRILPLLNQKAGGEECFAPQMKEIARNLLTYLKRLSAGRYRLENTILEGKDSEALRLLPQSLLKQIRQAYKHRCQAQVVSVDTSQVVGADMSSLSGGSHIREENEDEQENEIPSKQSPNTSPKRRRGKRSKTGNKFDAHKEAGYRAKRTRGQQKPDNSKAPDSESTEPSKKKTKYRICKEGAHDVFDLTISDGEE